MATVRSASHAWSCYEIRLQSATVCGPASALFLSRFPDGRQGGIGRPPSATNTLPVWGHGAMERPPSASDCEACQLAVAKALGRSAARSSSPISLSGQRQAGHATTAKGIFSFPFYGGSRSQRSETHGVLAEVTGFEPEASGF